MPSEDVLFSITSHHLTAGLTEADLAGNRDLAGFGGTAEIQAEIIGGLGPRTWPRLLWSVWSRSF
jgi:hypothetical protein